MRYSLVLLAFALGLMAKPMPVTLPFVLLLLDLWPLGRFRLAPGNAETHDGLGAVLARAGKTTEAIAHFTDALRIDPRFAQAYYHRALAHRTAGDAAAAQADRALAPPGR